MNQHLSIQPAGPDSHPNHTGQLNMGKQARPGWKSTDHAGLTIETRTLCLISNSTLQGSDGIKKSGVWAMRQPNGKTEGTRIIASQTEEETPEAMKKPGTPPGSPSTKLAQKTKQGGFTPIVGPTFHATPGLIQHTAFVRIPIHIGYEAEYFRWLNIQYIAANVEIYMRLYPEIIIDVSI
jgi:hypothetical protein